AFDAGGLGILAEVYEQPEELRAMVREFVVDIDKLLVQIEVSAQSANARELALAAHTLKSHSRTLGGLELAQRAFEIEQRGKKEHLAGDLLDLVGDLKPVHARFLVALNEHLNESN
ncbi:MAG: Hpt domain-containing protein, partial [Nannocystaceae bacterium]